MPPAAWATSSANCSKAVICHDDVKTVFGTGLSGYAAEAKLVEDKLAFEPAPVQSGNPKVLTSVTSAFQTSGRPERC